MKYLGCQDIVSAVAGINIGSFYAINSDYAAGGTSIADGGNDMCFGLKVYFEYLYQLY